MQQFRLIIVSFPTIEIFFIGISLFLFSQNFAFHCKNYFASIFVWSNTLPAFHIRTVTRLANPPAWVRASARAPKNTPNKLEAKVYCWASWLVILK